VAGGGVDALSSEDDDPDDDDDEESTCMGCALVLFDASLVAGAGLGGGVGTGVGTGGTGAAADFFLPSDSLLVLVAGVAGTLLVGCCAARASCNASASSNFLISSFRLKISSLSFLVSLVNCS
jgi:hypothetical protein